MGEPEWTVAHLEHFAWAQPSAEEQSGQPDLGGVHDHSHLGHYVHIGIDVAHFLDTLHKFHHWYHEAKAAAHGAAVVAGEVMGPLDAALLFVVVFSELHKAFTTTQRIESQKGISYGLLWEVLGVPDAPHDTRPSPFGEGTLPLTDSERQAFEEGVKEGREKAQDPEVRKAIEGSLAFEMARQERTLDTDPQHHAWNIAVDNTLNRIWDKVHEDEPALKGSTIPFQGTEDGFPKAPPKP